MKQRLTVTNIEDQYQISEQSQIERPNFVIISGCSGGGKSTLLSELAALGYSYVAEPGRQVVKEQSAIGGDALPWKNLDKFLELSLSRSLYQFNSISEKKNLVFFDRGIIDSVQPSKPQGIHFTNAAKKFRHNNIVFMLPPWKEIYRIDRERQHSFNEAKREYEELLIKYQQFNYEIIIVPHGKIRDRANFILSELAKRNVDLN